MMYILFVELFLATSICKINVHIFWNKIWGCNKNKLVFCFYGYFKRLYFSRPKLFLENLFFFFSLFFLHFFQKTLKIQNMFVKYYFYFFKSQNFRGK
jgi:hypothetical protein